MEQQQVKFNVTNALGFLMHNYESDDDEDEMVDVKEQAVTNPSDFFEDVIFDDNGKALPTCNVVPKKIKSDGRGPSSSKKKKQKKSNNKNKKISGKKVSQVYYHICLIQRLKMENKVAEAGNILNDVSKSLAKRYRALFALKNLGGEDAMDYISNCFKDPSALLKHELAYCLGQMQNVKAIPMLISVLEDKTQEPMVRHEAGEALGAIGHESALLTLKKYSNDPLPEVADTCKLAIDRIAWLKDKENVLHGSQYDSVDPAPPIPKHESDVQLLKSTLIDENLPLFDRYRAMFSLRNIGTEESAAMLAEGLKCSDSALFRHEIAYVLGQMQMPNVVPQLTASLKNSNENCMVRHECAEALGSIADENCLDILKKYANDPDPVVRESCEVALDMYEYETSSEFQYATTDPMCAT